MQATNRARARRRWPFTTKGTKDTKEHEALHPTHLVVFLFYSTFVPFVPSW